eukprot:10952781-Alexandrium_andersonii.AAC.1
MRAPPQQHFLHGPPVNPETSSSFELSHDDRRSLEARISRMLARPVRLKAAGPLGGRAEHWAVLAERPGTLSLAAA